MDQLQEINTVDLQEAARVAVAGHLYSQLLARGADRQEAATRSARLAGMLMVTVTLKGVC